MKSGKRVASGGAKRSLVLVVSVLVLVLAAVGGTLAWLVSDDSASNSFTPAYVTCTVDEKFESGIKSDVRIKNTGNIDAYIRAYAVVTWKDAQGNVYGQKPVAGRDYTMSIPTDTGWAAGPDECWYYTSPIASDSFTGVLISRCTLADSAVVPEGYSLSVEIIAEAIQSLPATTVADVWPVTVAADGSLGVKQGGVER